jgi:hypothetical protein
MSVFLKQAYFWLSKISHENHELKEVERLRKNVIRLKGKEEAQPSQDNSENMVNKLQKGSNLVVTLHLKDKIECIHLMCAPGIVAHISRQINKSVITMYIHHDITSLSS